jgi:hypothetical protein
LISGFDLAVFFLDYHDRFPTYQLNVTSPMPLAISLHGNHPRMKSVGFTGSKDISPVVVRWESLYTSGRVFDAIQGGQYVNVVSDEITGVLGVDYNGFENCRFGVQASKIHRLKAIEGGLLGNDRHLLSVHLNATIWKPVADVIFSYTPDDGSMLGQFTLTIPTSHQLELALGTALFLGTPRSQFGLFHSGSRAFVQLHAYFGG